MTSDRSDVDHLAPSTLHHSGEQRSTYVEEPP
jgi:hypothetical protein